MGVRVLVAGLGEVGRPIYELLAESGKFEVYGVDIDPSRTVHGFDEVPAGVDFLHVCYPYTGKFLDTTRWYVERYRPRRIIVHSTVAPGTTRKVYEELGIPVAFSPVRGKHPHIKEHLKFWPKWVAALPGEELDAFVEHLEAMGLRVKGSEHPETLELAKIYETVYRAVMIAFWQEAHRSARALGADIAGVAEFISEVHEVLRDRPVYYPAYIGGHCLIPNTRIIKELYPSPLWDFVLESNEKRLKEQEDPKVAEDIRRVKEVWRRHVPQWYYEGKAGPGD